MPAPQTFLFILAAFWIVYYLVVWLFLLPVPHMDKNTYRYQLIWRHFINKKKKATPRLCGYHAAAVLRKGQMAILDAGNCRECYLEWELLR